MPRHKDKVPPRQEGAPQFQKAIDAVVSVLTKKYGTGSIARLGDPGAYSEVKRVVPTGLPSLDVALGLRGWPLGKLVEVFGPESSGKSTLAKHMAGRAQLAGVAPVLIDTEQSGLAEYDKALGIASADALVSQPDTLEEVFGIMFDVVDVLGRQHTPSLIIWDSLAATYTQKEMEAELDEETRIAARPSFLTRHLPQLIKKLKSGQVGVMIVNQLREKIGAAAWQKQTYSPGGRALRHWAHARLEMTPMGFVVQGDRAVALKMRVKVIKNKLAPPRGEAELQVQFYPPRVVDTAAEKAAAGSHRRQAVE